MVLGILAVILSNIFPLLTAYLLIKVAQRFFSRANWEKNNLNLTAFSSGVLLAISTLHLLPEAVAQSAQPGIVYYFLLGGVLGLFFMERMVLWYHHHHGDHGNKPSVLLILSGDSVHNILDGVAIVSSFLISPSIGLLTTFAVVMHEVPQEVANFSILLNSGIRPVKAIWYKFMSGSTVLIGALIALIFQDGVKSALGYISAVTSGMFLYIALADLIPELHTKTLSNRDKWVQLCLLFFGLLVVILLGMAFED